MPATQLRLLPDPKPLVERLGQGFFRSLPRCPGVYLMHGQAGVILYVGKARNLRQRLGAYRVANPERMPRRTLRLLRLVERIAWEECPDEDAALRRESELLLAVKPRFNRAGVWRGPSRYVAWRAQPAGAELAILAEAEAGWQTLGPFGARVVQLHRVLLRLLWQGLHPGMGLAAMPAGWIDGAHGPRVLIAHPDADGVREACARLDLLAHAQAEPFRQWLPPAPCRFDQAIRDEDWESLSKSLRLDQPGSAL